MLLTITNVVFSAYCACTVCCGPGATGLTAAGTRPHQSVTLAGPRHLPLGTRIEVQLPGRNRRVYTIEDRTARRFDGRRWDIYFKRHEDARQFGLKTGSVTIISFPKPRKPPTTIVTKK